MVSVQFRRQIAHKTMAPKRVLDMANCVEMALVGGMVVKRTQDVRRCLKKCYKREKKDVNKVEIQNIKEVRKESLK